MTTCSECGYEAEEEFRFCPECGMRSSGGSEADPLIGRTLAGKYRVRSIVGAGSMGTVYRAEHTALQKPTAIKVLHRELQVSDEVIRRFQREGIAAGRFSHPNAIQIFDFDKTKDGRFFLAMEFVQGDDLKTLLERHGTLSTEQAVDLSCQLLDTLTEAHGHGIVHRDLKPENLMVVESSTGVRNLKVLDFGLSKLVDREVAQSMQTMAGRVLGTPLYMAPEQWRGEDVDQRADLYAAGLILFEMLAGRSPLAGRDVSELMLQSTDEPPPQLHDVSPGIQVPDDLADVLDLALAKPRDDRFQSAREMLAALENVRLDGPPARRSGRRSARSTTRSTGATRRAASSRIGSRAGPEPGPSARPRWHIGAAAGAVVLVAAGLYFWLSSSGAPAGTLLASSKTASQRTPEEAIYVALLDEARDRLADGNLDTAESLSAKALRSSAADAEGLLVHARVLRHKQDTATALADLREALTKHPKYGAAAALMGWIHLDQDALDEAESNFALAAKCADGQAEALAGQGALKVRRGDLDGASASLAQALAADPTLAVAQLWRGKACLGAQDFDGAIEAFVQAKRGDSRMWQALEGLGDAYRGKDKIDAAINSYEDALERGKGAASSAQRKLLDCLVSSEQWAKAQPLVDAALVTAARNGGKATDRAELDLLAALIAFGDNRSEDSLTALDRVVTTTPASAGPLAARAHLLLASLQLQRGAYQRCADLCEAASETLEDRPELFVTWGLALAKLDRHSEAVDQLELAVDLTPKDTFVLYTLGVLAKDYVADRAAALDWFQRYQKADGTDPRVTDWIRELR